MINKKNIWFLTLFSLILVLSVYYITMPSDMLITNSIENNEDDNIDITSDEIENSVLTALKIDIESSYEEELSTIKEVLTSSDSTVEEKNEAFTKMQNINNLRSEEENLESLIYEKFNLESLVKIDADQIRVVVAKEEHDTKIANNIMREVQNKYQTNKYITVKFQ